METQSARSAPPANTGPRETSTGARDTGTRTASAHPDARPAAGPRIILGGLPIRIQTPRGAMRSGLNPDGTPWQQEQKSHHGILEGTEHASQGPIHVFVHPGATRIAENARTFVVSHVDPATGRLTAPVVMLGFESPKQAQKAYQANFPRDRRKVGPIREMPASQLRERVNALRQSEKPASAISTEPSPSGHGRRDTPSNSPRQTQAGTRQGSPISVGNQRSGIGQTPVHTPQAAPSATVSNANTAPGLPPATQKPTPQRQPAEVQRRLFDDKIKTLLDNTRWQNLLQRLATNHATAGRRAQEGRTGRNPYQHFWDGALRHVRDSGTSSARVAEAVAAYALENYASAPPGVRETVAQLVDTARHWADRHSGVPSGAVTSAQLIDLTQAALRTAKEQDGTHQPSGDHTARKSEASRIPSDESGNHIPQRAPLFSSNDLEGVERASPMLLNSIGRKRVITWATPGSDPERFLDNRGAEAVAFGLEDIFLRPNPSKAATLEEFLHGTQQRLGIIDRLGTRGLGSAETHVKDFMIRHQKLLGLSAEDIRRIKLLREKGL